MTNGQEEIKRRIQELDSDPFHYRTEEGILADVRRFISILGNVTNTSMPKSEISAVDVDTMQAQSRLLKRLEKIVPEIVKGPLRLEEQYWVGKSHPDKSTKDKLIPNEKSFNALISDPLAYRAVKPFSVGFFTSTGILNTYGMWKLYITPFAQSGLYPLPWAVWKVQPESHVKILEIKSAHDWEKIILTYPYFEKDLLYPDWKCVAQDYDAIHMNLRAIAAIQGFYLKT